MGRGILVTAVCLPAQRGEGLALMDFDPWRVYSLRIVVVAVAWARRTLRKGSLFQSCQLDGSDAEINPVAK